MFTEQAWAEFKKPLSEYISKRIADKQDAEDILQEVFIKIHLNIDNNKQKDKFVPWLYSITRNAVTDYYRKKANKPVAASIPYHISYEENEEHNANKEIAQCLKPMIKRLPRIYRQAILLSEFQNITQAQLARELGLSVSGAKSRIRRAKKLLKEMLLDCCSLERDRCGNIIDYNIKNKNGCGFC